MPEDRMRRVTTPAISRDALAGIALGGEPATVQLPGPAAGITDGLRGSRLRAPRGVDIASLRPLTTRRRVKFHAFTDDLAERAEAARMLLDEHGTADDVVLALYDKNATGDVAALQTAFLDAVTGAVWSWVAAGEPVEERLPDLIRAAASATPAGAHLRSLFAPGRAPAPVDPPDGDAGFYPRIPVSLLTTTRKYLQGACAGALIEGMTEWGNAMQGATPSYIVGAQIAALSPPDGCSPDTLTITGTGFGGGSHSSVVFTAEYGGLVIAEKAEIVSWSDTAVQVRIPQRARRGPVGLVDLPTVPPTQAAAALGAKIGECFPPGVLARLTDRLDAMHPGISAPVPQPGAENLFTGGPPIIDYFSVTPTTLYPGQTTELRWSVAGADSVTIVPRQVNGQSNELPNVSAPPGGHPAAGTAALAVPGTSPWVGAYVLQATNKCTGTQPVERVVEVTMSIRLGLALGGGGTRGDFQVGALLYLYDEMKIRPDAIASTSVGSINALDLVMGDDPGRSAAARLAENWKREIVDESRMWSDEVWTSSLRKDVHDALEAVGRDGILALPYAGSKAGSAQAALGRMTGGFFNLDPLKVLLRRRVDEKRAARSGIALRMVAVSLETGELVYVDENGELVHGAGAGGPKPTLIEGAIASATMPGVFPPQRLGPHMCVDGGVRQVVPVLTAVTELGCNKVYAIRVSAPPTAQPFDPNRKVPGVIARSVLGVTYDQLADYDVAPFGGWGPGVEIVRIDATKDLHDPLVVEPGLIRIAIDYGWMRAADVVSVPDELRQRAFTLSDEITLLRARNWRLTHWAAGAIWEDPHRSLDYMLSNGQWPPQYQTSTLQDPETITHIRNTCVDIHKLVAERQALPARVPAWANSWFLDWESVPAPPPGSPALPLPPTPWDAFRMVLGDVKAETPPSTLV